MEGNLPFFALFYVVFEGNFQVQVPRGLIFGGAISQKAFCVMSLGGLYLEGLMEGLIFGILQCMKRELVKNGEREKGHLDLKAQLEV